MKIKTKKLGLLTNLRAGIGFPNAFQGKQNEQIPFYKVGDISREFQRHNYYLQEADNYVSYEDLELLKGKLFEAETIVFAKVGEALKLNRRCILTKPALIDNNVFGIKSNSKELDNKYLFYYLLTVNLAEICRTGAVPSVNQSDVNSISIPLPDSIEEQQEIVHVLDTMSDIIRLREECISHAQDLIPALFQEMFGDLDCNNSYKKVLFGDIITVLTDYHANGSYEKLKEHVTLLDNPDYALMVRTTDLEKNNFIDNVKYISQSAYEFLEKSKIYGGEIIINKIGSAGNVYLMPKLNRPVSLGMNAFLIRIDEKCANNIFIYNLLTSSYGKKIIQEKVSGAVTKTITKNSIRSLKLYLPPVEQQELFAEKAQEIEAYIKTQQAELENAKQMFQSLLHHAFTGELTRHKFGGDANG